MTLFLAWLLAFVFILFLAFASYLLFTSTPRERLSSFFDRKTRGYSEWIVRNLDRMFITVTPNVASLMIICSTVLFALSGWIITLPFPDNTFFNILRVIIIILLSWGPGKMIGGWTFPKKAISHMWKKRLDKFDNQMVDALTLMSNSLKSGLSLPQAMEMVKEELPRPVSEEFGLVLDHLRLGATIEESLRRMEERLDTEDVRIIATSIIILRESGGNLSETFDTIAYTIRERQKVLDRIKTLTSQGVYQGVIITCMPFVLGLILYIMDPRLISRLWETTLGWILIFAMLFLQFIGALLIRKIVTIKV